MQFAVPPRLSSQPASSQSAVSAVPKSVVKAVGKQLTQLGLPTTASKKKDVDSGVKVITRRDYQSIISLRLAGRSNKEIAKKFGKPLEKIRGHIERAMAEYRKGRIKPEAGGVAGEAREKGKDKSIQFAQDFQKGLEKVELLPVLGDGPKSSTGNVSSGGNLSPDAVSVDLSFGEVIQEIQHVQYVGSEGGGDTTSTDFVSTEPTVISTVA